MKRITDERTRIDGYRFTVGGAEFFNDRKYREDFEWLILSYLTRILTLAGQLSPEYAEKLSPPAPDFQTYLASDTPFRRIEVTEVLRPDYRRGEVHSQRAKSSQRFYDVSDPHSQPWSSFHRVLRAKLAKPYALNSWLLIYHDMPASEFADFSPWHERVRRALCTWTNDSATTCDITASHYESIYVVDCNGEGAVRLHPHWDVVRGTPFP